MIKWNIKEENDLFSEKLYKIKSLQCHHPEKKVSHDFHIIETYDWINIVALTEDNQFILVKQHRLGTDKCTIETVAGLIEKGEDPKEAAKRELLEETGYSAENISIVNILAANPAIMNNHIYVYLATGCKKICEQNLDAAEDIEVLTYSEDEIRSMIKEGDIDHSIAVMALSLHFMIG